MRLEAITLVLGILLVVTHGLLDDSLDEDFVLEGEGEASASSDNPHMRVSGHGYANGTPKRQSSSNNIGDGSPPEESAADQVLAPDAEDNTPQDDHNDSPVIRSGAKNRRKRSAGQKRSVEALHSMGLGGAAPVNAAMTVYAKKKGGCNAACRAQRARYQAEVNRRKAIEASRRAKWKALNAKIDREQQRRMKEGARRDRLLSQATVERAQAAKERMRLRVMQAKLTKDMTTWKDQTARSIDKMVAMAQKNNAKSSLMIKNMRGRIKREEKRMTAGFKRTDAHIKTLKMAMVNLQKSIKNQQDLLRDWVKARIQEHRGIIRKLDKQLDVLKKQLDITNQKQAKNEAKQKELDRELDDLKAKHVSITETLTDSAKTTGQLGVNVNLLHKEQQGVSRDYQQVKGLSKEDKLSVSSLVSEVKKFQDMVGAVSNDIDNEANWLTLQLKAHESRVSDKIDEIAQKIGASDPSLPSGGQASGDGSVSQAQMKAIVTQLGVYFAKMKTQLSADAENLIAKGNGASMSEWVETLGDRVLQRVKENLVNEGLVDTDGVPVAAEDAAAEDKSSKGEGSGGESKDSKGDDAKPPAEGDAAKPEEGKEDKAAGGDEEAAPSEDAAKKPADSSKL